MNACFYCARFVFSSITSEEIISGKLLRNDLFCVEWDVKPQLSQSVTVAAFNLSTHVVLALCALFCSSDGSEATAEDQGR